MIEHDIKGICERRLNMGRRSLSTWETERKRELEKQLREFSIEALKNIQKIATRSLDERTRLEANKFLFEKAVGKNYVLYDELQQASKNDLNIRLIPVGVGEEQQSVEAWNTQEDSEDWGNDIYIP